MTSVPATTFPRFLDLPFEIRWAIYELCLPTRVVESGIVPNSVLHSLPSDVSCRELGPALRYIVGKYSRMPVISRAIPEVYRKVRQQVVSPPAFKRAWNWVDSSGHPEDFFHDPRPILFDPKVDVLYVSPRDYPNDPHILARSPCWLARNPEAIVALEAWSMKIFDPTSPILNYCFLGRKHCIIVLSETRLVKPMEFFISTGLFGLFGEERTVLVNVDDYGLVDYYDKKLNGQDIHPRKWYKEDSPVMPGGIRRYSSHGTVDQNQAWDEDSPVVSAEDRAQLIAEDKNEMLRLFKVVWLVKNECWDKSSWLSNIDSDPSSWVFDEEHPDAKFWLDKLPTFSFAVRVHAQDLEECRRLWAAGVAWDWEKQQRTQKKT